MQGKDGDRMNKAFDKILEFIDEQIKIEESIAKSKNEGHPITHQYGANCMNVVKNSFRKYQKNTMAVGFLVVRGCHMKDKTF